MTDLEVAGTDRALTALRQPGLDRALASPEQVDVLFDAIREIS